MNKSIENLPSDNIKQLHKTIQMSVVDRLRSFILTNQLSPGERLIQVELAKKLGVSRTPIREALNILASEGLVTLSPYKGATVTRLSLSDLEELYCVRFALESHAGYLAAINISDEEIEELEEILQAMAEAAEQRNVSALKELNFHFNKKIFIASRKSFLCEQTIMFMRAADKYRRIHFSVRKLTTDAIAEHWELVEALKKHDPKAVVEISRKQNQRSVSAMKQLIQGHVN
ncbi:MAG: GntR family transcriptional regulator [Anaerolineaceae bacterium]|nr:GntR family transcriptional regulator [Anaerolineaceae bacterium]